MEELFVKCLKQEIEHIKKQGKVLPAWNISEKLNTADFTSLITHLFSNKEIKDVLKTEQQIEFALLRAFDRYFINISFIGKIKFNNKLAQKVYAKWIKEIKESNSEIVILASMLNFEVNRKIKIGDIEFLPVLKNGNAIDLEKNLYKMLGFKGIRDIKQIDVLVPYRITYFFGGNAIRISGKFQKRSEFYQYSSMPEPGYQELVNKIKNIVILLRLFKSGDFTIGSYHSVVLSPFTPGEMSSGDKKYTSGYQYPLVDRKEIIKLRYFAKKFLPVIEKIENLPSNIQIGIEYLNSSYEKEKIHEKFIDIMIALDALFGASVETSYRVSLRAAIFLGKDKDDRKEIYGKVKNALGLRGKLVHGNIHPNKIDKNEIEQSRLYIENIVRRTLIQLLEFHIGAKLKSDYKTNFEEEFIL